MSGTTPRLVHQREGINGNPQGLLICFSHLRWNFVFQRPQHLITRAAKLFSVLFIEEPIFQDNCRAHLDTKITDGGVTIVTPILPGV